MDSVHCGARVYTVAYNTWFCSTATMCAIKRPHKDKDAQQLRTKHVYWQIRAPAAPQVRSDYSLPRLVTQVSNSAKLCQPAISRNAKDDRVPPLLKVYFFDSTEDEGLLLRVHDRKASLEDRTDGPYPPYTND